MRTMLFSILVILFVARAQSQVPSPESFFGFSVGDRHLRPDQIAEYLKTLAAPSRRFSDRICLEVVRQSNAVPHSPATTMRVTRKGHP